MRVTVFVGPTMGIEECREILPDAVYRPPAEQGDLLYAHSEDRAEVLVLIDGTFHHNLSVWHNEVCYLLSVGVRVLGASSMGALRAAETERFGTVGVGTIFEWYRDGVITGDDEVALLHGRSDAGYRTMSLPMVNIRASLAAAVSDGRLDQPAAALVVQQTTELFYPNRQLPGILAACRRAGLPGTAVDAVADALTRHYVDLKRDDARAALKQVREMVEGRCEPPPRVSFDFTRSSVFETLYNLDRRIPVGGDSVRLQEIAEYAALHLANFAELRTSALNRELAVFLGLLLGVKPSRDEVIYEAQVFRAAHGIGSDDELEAWLRASAMSEADLGEYLAQEAMCRTLRNWIMFARSFDRGCKPTLDELRVRGLFPELAASAYQQSVIAENFADQPEYASVHAIKPAELAAHHASRTGVRITGNARLWSRDAGFESVDDLIEGLQRSVIALDVQERIAAQASALADSQTQTFSPTEAASSPGGPAAANGPSPARAASAPTPTRRGCGCPPASH